MFKTSPLQKSYRRYPHPLSKLSGATSSSCVCRRMLGTRNLQVPTRHDRVRERSTGTSKAAPGGLSSGCRSMIRMIAPHRAAAPAPTTPPLPRTVRKAVVPAAGLAGTEVGGADVLGGVDSPPDEHPASASIRANPNSSLCRVFILPLLVLRS